MTDTPRHTPVPTAQSADAVWPVLEQKGGTGELFLSFGTAALGQCALPVRAVQTVASADGPFRAVPGRRFAGSHFLGLVSVRAQVQMLFDLSIAATADAPAPAPAALPVSPVDCSSAPTQSASAAAVVGSARAAGAPPDSAAASAPATAPVAAPQLRRGEHLVVAVAADGRTLALRVQPQLRLVRAEVKAGSHSVAGNAFASLVCGTLVPAAGQTEETCLLSSEALFACLEKEVAGG